MMYPASRGIAALIKERVNSKRKKKRSGRILRLFDYGMYAKIRSNIERFYAWMKSFRRNQMMHDRLASTYFGFVQLGCVMILMRKIFK
jgi:transposase